MKVPCNALLLAAILTATSRTIQKGKQQEQFLNTDDSVTSPRMYAYSTVCLLHDMYLLPVTSNNFIEMHTFYNIIKLLYFINMHFVQSIF